ncbi:manganese efflux pump MntP [Brotaphodocola sp.]|uniref:manganese efflux pump MntP n=1 Tax=Brotaphodocola sp. TaxID=3073577 RepID=UPI003D7D08CA
MHFFELFLIAVGLSMDAGAAAICKGLSIPDVRLSHGIIIGAYFGIFQALMPLIGYYLGIHFLDVIGRFDHWIAFLLLALIGCMMIHESFFPEEKTGTEMDLRSPKSPTERKSKLEIETKKETRSGANASLRVSEMLLLAIATSIDALITGITFAFLNISILPAACLIGVTTFLLSVICVLAGSRLQTRFHSYAGLVGGILLILMGFRILVRHLH